MRTLNRRILGALLASAWIGTVAAQATEEEDLALAYAGKRRCG